MAWPGQCHNMGLQLFLKSISMCSLHSSAPNLQFIVCLHMLLNAAKLSLRRALPPTDQVR